MSLTTSQSGRGQSLHKGTGSANASPALEWLWSYLRDVRSPAILDCGPVRRATVEVLLARKVKLHISDVISPLQAGDTSLWNRAGKTPVFRTELFLAPFPSIEPGSLSAVFCWHLLDLLPREAQPAVVARLLSYLDEGGVLFCILREPYLPAGAEVVWRMENLTNLAPEKEGTKPFPYPALTNREMERLVAPGSVKTFLTRSGRREVLGIK